jgi:Uma2 family endonuclease
MASEPLQRLSPQDYLAFERQAEAKHEYVGGEVFAMAGASANHNLIVAHLVSQLDLQMLDRPCRVYPSDLRVAVAAEGPFYYPDVVALCDEPRFLDDETDTLLNPAVVIEVLSPSTEAFDRGLKFAHYRTIASLREVVFVAQGTVRVEHFVRQPDGHWLLSDHSTPEAVVELPSLECHLALSRIYDKVESEPPPPPGTN